MRSIAVCYAVALTGLVYLALYLTEQRYFPYWDGAAYEQFTTTVASAFGTSLSGGAVTVIGSLSEDYNYLFTVPLVPFFALFGESRTVFIFALYIVYFVPYVALAMLYARRVFPDFATEAGIVAAVAALLTPAAWWHLALGYPDVGGGAIITAMLLLYGASDRGRNLKRLAWIALLGTLAILFRRHYVYAVAAVYAAFILDTIRPLAETPDGRARQLRALASVAAAGAVSALLLFLAAPGFVTRSIGGGFQASLASWQGSPMLVASTTLGTIGAPALVLAVVGLGVSRQVSAAGAPAARVLAYAAIIWSVMWIVYVRQSPYHYPHILPLLVIVGLTGTWLYLRKRGSQAMRRYGALGLLAFAVLNFLISMPVLKPAIASAHVLPRFATADPILPTVNPAYDQIVALVSYLRTHTTPDDAILVGASSPELNYDLLANAERNLYGSSGTKLGIKFSPQVDSRDAPPVTDLLSAKIVVTATPFQHHLAPDQQKVVQVIDAAFDEHWPVSKDFVRLPERFTLGEPGSEVDLYRRVRPASPAVAEDTQRRVVAYMKGEPAAQLASAPAQGGVWVERSSPYPLVLAVLPSGGYTFTGHPTRAAQEPPTVIETHADKPVVTISGTVHVYDERCAGVDLRAGTDYRAGARELDGGVFTARPNDRPFKLVVRDARARSVFLRLASNPASPDRIEYCTTRIDRLTTAAK